MHILFNNEELDDVICVLRFINDYTESLNNKDVEIDVRALERVIRGCKKVITVHRRMQQQYIKYKVGHQKQVPTFIDAWCERRDAKNKQKSYSQAIVCKKV